MILPPGSAILLLRADLRKGFVLAEQSSNGNHRPVNLSGEDIPQEEYAR